MQITVDLGERSYPIQIGSGLLGNQSFADAVPSQRCLVVTNTTVAPLYIDHLAASLGGCTVDSIALPDGEAHKTLQTLSLVHDKLAEIRAARDISVIALGGGVVGDIAGFAAATWMRGVNFIQVPTTLLAQVDSSVGGKTGVNHAAGKNLLGAFHQPSHVFIDTDTLATLPDREFRAGLAEVIKYGAIADAAFLDWLETGIGKLVDRDDEALAFAIRRSCELKAEVVADDEREAGRRAILNFGHTFGHAIERCQGYGDWLHGEAVAAGMLMAARLSDVAESDQQRLAGIIDAAGLPTEPPAIAASRWREAIGMDKKVLGQRPRFVVLEALGAATVTSDVDEQRLTAILEAKPA